MKHRIGLIGWLGVIAAALCASGTAAAQTTLTQECTPEGGAGTWRVTWSSRPTPYGTVYQVASRSSPNGLTAWTLHHRPVEGLFDTNGDGWAENHWSADVFRNGSAIDGYSMASLLIPRVKSGWADKDETPEREDLINLTTLTSPGGECVFSPERTDKLVAYRGARANPKLVVTGDSLTNQTELCGLAPDSPPGCPPSLSTRLRNTGFRTFVRAGHGQGFSSWLSAIREQATTRPSVYVLALSTNDASYMARGTTQAERDARGMITAASVQKSFAFIRDAAQGNPNACIVLVTASEKSRLNGYTDQARIINGYLRTLAGPRTIIADWAQTANDYCGEDWPEDDSTCDWFIEDQLHLSYAGTAARNDEIVDAVSLCPR